LTGLYVIAFCGGLVSSGLAADGNGTGKSDQLPVSSIKPAVITEPVSKDADDPAVWMHPTDPARSLIIGTNKAAAPDGSLNVFGIDGKTRQVIGNLDRPNNVDVEYGLAIGGRQTDIVVATERNRHCLRIYRVSPEEGKLVDLAPAGLPVFEGETGDASEPMGIALYRRPKDGAVFAIVGRKGGPRQGYLWQYRLEDNGQGGVKATKVRSFGSFLGKDEIESIAVDDALGYVYYSDERIGIHKWHADPEHPDAARELACFGREGFAGDHEGIGIYTRADGTGYIVCTDQVENNSEYRIYRREGEPGNPHDHSRLVKVVRGGADDTDGIEVVSGRLGAGFPHGLLIVMNSRDHNFFIFRWEDVAAGEPRLATASR